LLQAIVAARIEPFPVPAENVLKDFAVGSRALYKVIIDFYKYVFALLLVCTIYSRHLGANPHSAHHYDCFILASFDTSSFGKFLFLTVSTGPGTGSLTGTGGGSTGLLVWG